MAKTNTERFADSMIYLIGIDPDLAVLVTRELNGREDEVGGELSLNRTNESENQRRAHRALLLCHYAFFEPPHAMDANGNAINLHAHKDLGKSFWRDFSELEIRTAIESFLRIPGATLQDLVTAATTVQNGAAARPPGFENFSRQSVPFPYMSICFHALTYWLFKAGFTSEHWLTSNGARLIADTANDILGQGEVVTPGEEHLIPAGWLFNIHKTGDQTVCHWGVSMGDGWAVAVNTTPQERGDTAVVFRNDGNNFYGEFTLTSSVAVCRYKYADVLGGPPVDVTLRKIDPTTVNTFT